jgi:hypothetical protein
VRVCALPCAVPGSSLTQDAARPLLHTSHQRANDGNVTHHKLPKEHEEDFLPGPRSKEIRRVQRVGGPGTPRACWRLVVARHACNGLSVAANENLELSLKHPHRVPQWTS